MNIMEKEALLQAAGQEFEHETPQRLLQWAVDQYSNITFACSFGAEDVVILDILSEIAPTMDVFYLDTDLHFAETYETRDRLAKRYSFHFIQVKSRLTLEEQEEQYGPELWKRSPDLCCHLRKVEPLTRILSRYDAWITGIRREQSPTRANAPKAHYDERFGLAKFNPLASWTMEEVWKYIRSRQVPYNPLHDKNYPSIGCYHCTRPVEPGEDTRAGRWSGHQKMECGLHQ